MIGLFKNLRVAVGSIIIASILSACAGSRSVPVAEESSKQTIASGFIYESSARRAQSCLNDANRTIQSLRSPKFELCSTPDPGYTQRWELQLDSAYVYVSYGEYNNKIARSSFGSCVGDQVAQISSGALTLASALSAQRAAWMNSPNGAKVASLLVGYTAGEITASGFVAGVIAVLGSTPLILSGILVGTGLTVWGLVRVLRCQAEA